MRILSWNILAQEWVTDEYRMKESEDDRYEKIIKIIKSIDSDIILLQEVSEKIRYFLKRDLENYKVSNLIRSEWCAYKGGKSGTLNLVKRNINCKFVKEKIFINNLVIINVHLDDICSDRRKKQLDKILRFSKKFESVVIGGDFNQENFSEEKFKEFQIRQKTETYVMFKSLKIDNFLIKNIKSSMKVLKNKCSKNWKCQIRENGSDHYPILLSISLSKGF